MRRQREVRQARLVTFRGTVLEARHFRRIQRVVDADPSRTRQDVVREICRLFDWRRANGTWAIRGARQVLVRLDEAGVIRLPAPRRKQGRPHREELESAARQIPSASEATPAEAMPRGSVLDVRPIGAQEVLSFRAHMERFHYLGDAALIGESLRYAATLDGELVALLSWGAASLRNGPRNRYVGWDEAQRTANLQLVVNNARFLVLSRRPHLASRVLAANLRRLSRDWEEAYGHPVVLAETFVDTSRFRGTCYHASNWISVGETKGWSKSGDTYRFNGQPKAVWLYPLTHNFKHRLCTITRTTMEGTMDVDVKKLSLNGQGGLFALLSEIRDTRKARGIRHKLSTILGLGICAVLAGARSFMAMGEWAAAQPRETLVLLGSRREKPPNERTFRRAFSSINVEDVDRRTGRWMAEQQETLAKAKAIALDGKVVRGSGDGDGPALQLLSAIVHGSGVVVAQVTVESKTNEITRVEPLLEDLDIKGKVVTADALHTQKKFASYLVEKKKADYVFIAKDNQPTLKNDIATLGLDGFSPSAHDRR